MAGGSIPHTIRCTMHVERKTETNEIFESFLKLEERANFLEITVDDVLIWERIRHSVYRDIKQSLQIQNRAHTSSRIESTPRRYLNALRTFAEASLTNNPILTNKYEILVYGHARRKQLQDGLWWDIYFDPIYEQVDLDYVHLEKQYQNSHLTPAKTEILRYRDFIYNLSRLWRKVGVGLPGVNSQDLTDVELIEDEIESEFGVEMELKESIRYNLELRQPLLRLYGWMLQRIDPDVALLVVSYGRETFIEACNQEGVPVVELQHGVIHESHMGYSYPGSRRKVAFPDYLLTWGEFWNDQVEFPIPEDRVITVGYPYLEESRKRYEDTTQRRQILFISQGTIGEELSKFALEADQHPEIDHDIVYKLHPGEYDRWRDEYPWLVDADIEIVDNSEPPLYELFAESSVQVGVSSTAIYEGLAFDLETYVYDCPGSEVLQPLVDDNAARIVSSADEIVAELGRNKPSFDQERYFATNATKNTCDVLERLVDEGTVYTA